jgi:hypothetical protein
MWPIVYLATNLTNGKRYIGATSRSLEVRRYEHEWCALKGKASTCRFFHAAIRKYGVGVFEWRVLGEYENFRAKISAALMGHEGYGKGQPRRQNTGAQRVAN